MAELLIEGEEPQQRIKKTLADDQVLRIGRSPGDGLKIPWDQMISREHADVFVKNGKLHVVCLPKARNDILLGLDNVRECVIEPGTQFQIGQTIFQFIDAVIIEGSESLFEEHTYLAEEVQTFNFKESDERLEILTRLPELIGSTGSDEEFASKLVTLLLKGIQSAKAAAVVAYDLKNIGSFDLENTTDRMDADFNRTHEVNVTDIPERPQMMRWDAKSDVGRFRPSRRLMKAALLSQQTRLHIWTEEGNGTQEFTMSGDLDWAFCTPLKSEACRGWSLYVSGEMGVSTDGGVVRTADDLKPDLRFAELLAQFIEAVRQVRLLENRQVELSRFFSPKTIAALVDQKRDEYLAPKESDISVLFCDLRGFSKKSEEFENNLLGLLDRMSSALGIMTHNIMAHDGCIADFQGDAALAFWGWPNRLPEGSHLACLAALEIVEEIAHSNQDEQHLLHNFGLQVGIGIGHGNAIAGQIGTEVQSKVGVFGPVVNTAARLESMTKQFSAAIIDHPDKAKKRFGVSILLDESAAEFAEKHVDASVGRVRRLAHVTPKGMKKSLWVSELIPMRVNQADEFFTEEYLSQFDAVVQKFHKGQWSECQEQIEAWRAWDAAAQFLFKFAVEQKGSPPANWDGVIRLNSK